MDATTAQTRIDSIDAILAAGATMVSIAGRTLTYDFAELRRERDRLQAYLNRGTGGRNIRVGRYNPNYTE